MSSSIHEPTRPVLTLSKVVVEVGNRADAARAGDYRLELEAAPEAFARSDYQLAEQGMKRGLGAWLVVVVAGHRGRARRSSACGAARRSSAII